VERSEIGPQRGRIPPRRIAPAEALPRGPHQGNRPRQALSPAPRTSAVGLP